MVVADSHNHRVCVYTESGGHFVRAFGARGGGEGVDLLYPRGVCVDEWSGSCAEVFIADCMNHRVVVATADGAFVRAFGRHGRAPGELMNPNGVCLDRGRGVCYVSDCMNHRVSVFRADDGAFVEAFGGAGHGPGELRGPIGLALREATGELFVADSDNHRVSVFRAADGRFARAIGRRGAAAGELENPCDVALDGDGYGDGCASERLFVVENGNHRVSVFCVASGACLGVIEGLQGPTCLLYTSPSPRDRG